MIENSSHDLLEQLRKRYLERSELRLASIDEALDELEVHPRAETPLETLVRAFHGFAGSGNTYGFAQVTLLGQEGEALSQRLAAEGNAVPPDQYRRLRDLSTRIRESLVSEAKEPVGTFLPLTTPITSRGNQRRNALLVGERASAPEIRSALSDSGMSVSFADGVTEASRSIEGRIPDALITDVQLPDGSGYELVRRVRERADGDRTAAFVIRSHEDFLDKVEAIRCGADGSFQEPVDEKAVVRRLNMVLERVSSEPPVILSVEDEPEQAEYIRAVLESAGYRVHTCSDPRDFEKALSVHDPDLLLMDVLLPDVSGYELARYVRQDEAHAALPILFLTTESQAEAAIESIRSGADDILLKPVSPTMLLTSVAVRIERSRMLTHLLERDGLTGLLTHTAFIERLAIAFKEQTRSDRRLTALVMIDIDHFKRINDQYGHPAGDRVLASLAGYLRRRLRQSDTIGRYGGEEFAILLNDLEASEAKRLIEHMLEEFSGIQHPVAPDEAVSIRFSAGVAMLDSDRMAEVGEWIAAADAALYHAKETGRARVEIGGLKGEE